MAQPDIAELMEDLELIRNAVVGAGIIATGYFRQDVKTWTKDNASPVTEADFAVDKFLKDMLTGARPDYGWLSEETADDPIRLKRERVFVVDPIDGTRGFIRGEDSWTICIAIVQNGEPVVSVIYAPIRDELYEAVRGQGAMLNKTKLERRHRLGAGPIIPAPGAVHRELEERGIDYVRGPAIPSLAYRLVQVSTGVLDIAVARRGAQDWDIAAPALILAECNHFLEDVCLGVPRFNKQEIRHGALAAMSDLTLKDDVHDVLRKVYGCPA